MNNTARILPLYDLPPKQTASAMMKQQPSRDILFEYQRGGASWQAMDIGAVYEFIEIALKSGVEFSERMAIADLHYWIDRQQVKPYRYYAKRWGWGLRKTYNLFVSIGIYAEGKESLEGSREVAGGEQQGSREVAEQPDSKPKSTCKVAGGEQQGSREVAGGEQYYTSPSPSGELIPSLPPRSAEEVIAYGAEIGVSEALCRTYYDRFQGQGWIQSNHLAVADWRARLRVWDADETERSLKRDRSGGQNGQGKQSGTPGLQPAKKGYTTPERRAALRREREEIGARFNSLVNGHAGQALAAAGGRDPT